MLAEEEGEPSSWEARAEQLYNLCDRECKGFITKRDLQRLWGELPLGPDELEGVFDSLDQDHNGFLTLQEFTDGFGHHLGLVVEFRADCSSPKDSEDENEEGDEKDNNEPAESGSISSEQIDEILNCFSKLDFNISPSVVESVWQDVCQNDGAADDSSLGRLVTALLQELSRSKTEQAQLEAALTSKTEQFNLQVAHLYEELESQISGERNKVAAEHNEKGARALASLEQEVKDREIAFRNLQEDNAALMKKVQQLTSLVTAGKQDNLRLTQHLSKLEEECSLKEKEAEELAGTLEYLRKGIKEEKHRRAQQALRVCEGISLERENLVTQLDLLRSINTELRDEHDQSRAPTANENDRSRYPYQEQLTASAPIPPKRNTVTFESSVAITTDRPVPPKNLPLPEYDKLASTSVNEIQSQADFEHDENYFQNVSVSADEDPLFPSMMSPSPSEPSILQELLERPCQCMTSDKNLSNEGKPRVKFQRTDSITQTSPTLSITNDQQLDCFSCRGHNDTPGDTIHSVDSPDIIKPTQSLEEDICHQNNDKDHYDHLSKASNGYSTHPTKDISEHTKDQNNRPKSCLKKSRAPDITRVCNCERKLRSPASNLRHSSTIIFHPGLPIPQPDLLPQTHTNKAFIHSQHTFHSHTYLPIVQMHSQSTTTSDEDFQQGDSKQDEKDSPVPAKFQDVTSADIEDKPGENTNCTVEETLVKKPSESDVTGKCHSGSYVEQMNNKNRKVCGANDSSKSGDADNLKKDSKDANDDSVNRTKVEPQEQDQEPLRSRIIPLSSVTTTRIFKIVFIGDSAVGKTTFIHRASVGEFRNFSTTVGVDYRLMHICVGGINALLQLWDTAGQERYKAITRQYYRKADCVVVMYDITCERSFLHVADWISSVREFGDSNLVLAIIGNKKDLQKARKVNVNNAYALAKTNEALLYEVSAAKNSGVTEVMKHIAGILTTDQQHNIDTSSTVTLHQCPKMSPRFNAKCCQ